MDIIVTAGTPAALAVKRTTATIPLVMVAVGDPVDTGLVKSLARPGGSLTGLVSIGPDLEGKRLELLTQIVPKLLSVAFLANPANPLHVTSEKQASAAAKALHQMLADRLFLHHRARIVEFTARHRLPAVYAYNELVQAGGLMSFGPSYPEMHRRAAYFVDTLAGSLLAAPLAAEAQPPGTAYASWGTWKGRMLSFTRDGETAR